jgi:L-lactate dehydrogenase
MKVGVIGVGHVGGDAALSMALRGSCQELVLIDADRQLAVSQALDIAQTSALACGPKVRAGDYQDLAGAEVVVLAPGINEKAGGADKPGDKEGRLRLLDTNVRIFCEILPKTIAAAPDATSRTTFMLPSRPRVPGVYKMERDAPSSRLAGGPF